MMAFLELNLLVFTSKRVSNAEPWDFFFLLIWTGFWTNSRITRIFTRFNVHVMPVYFNL